MSMIGTLKRGNIGNRQIVVLAVSVSRAISIQ